MSHIEALLLLSRARYGDGCVLVGAHVTGTPIEHTGTTYKCQVDNEHVATILVISSYLSKDSLLSLYNIMSANGPLIILLTDSNMREHASSLSSTVSGNIMHLSDIKVLHRISALVPQHRRVTAGELDDLANACIDVNSLPRISQHDPMALWYGFRRGDIVLCSSSSDKHYRIVR